MKKILLLLLILLVVAGCAPVPESELPEVKVTIEDTSASPDPETTFISDEINFGEDVVTSAITEETDKYSINVQFPRFEGQPELNELLKAIAVTETSAFKQEVQKSVTDEYMQENKETFQKSYLHIIYRVIRQDDKIISVVFEGDYYISGAAHSAFFFRTVNWNVPENKQYQWSDIITGDQDIPQILSEMVKPHLYRILQIDENVTSDWIEKGAGPKAENFEKFTVDLYDINIYFDPYQVAPYAAGPVVVNLSFDELGVLLNSELREDN
jgi:hypothetical protein